MNDPIHWATKTLKESGYCIDNPIPEKILETAWSQVCRFLTNHGYVYLKKVPPPLSLESNIIKVLHQQFHAKVPVIIAENQELHCFLMHDAGISLHEFFKQNFKKEILIQVLQDYTALQLMTADHIDIFLNLGVPDWRLEQLPKRYQQLIAEENLLLQDGLSSIEIKKLQHLDTKLLSICDQLSQYNIPDTLGHCDFHDKNILVNIHTHQTTIIDLGEVAVTHPFFSFHNCFYRATEHYALSENQYKKLQTDCFKNWLCLESQTHLFEILEIIQKCWSIHAVLGEYRLIKSIDPLSSEILSRQGRFAEKLRVWIGNKS